MADIVDSATRSRMMSNIRGKDTKPEVAIRKKLFSLGFRYRLHDAKLEGKPDIVLPKYRAVILFNGCFWHKHDCELFKMPKTRTDFWQNKLNRNVQKDAENRAALLSQGWRVLVIWECAIRGAGKKRGTEIEWLSDKIVKWLKSNRKELEIKG